MAFKQDNSVIIEPRETHEASIIWLHGLGADGQEFAIFSQTRPFDE